MFYSVDTMGTTETTTVQHVATSSTTTNSLEISRRISELQAEIRTLKRRNEDLHTQWLNQFSTTMMQQHVMLKRLCGSVNRLEMMRRIGGGENRVNTSDENPNHSHVYTPTQSSDAVLTKYPCDLYYLWDEYECGVNGKKAASTFTSVERGRCRSMYSFRKTFWRLVEKLIQRGESSRQAIDRIYRVYGLMRVSRMNHAIRRDPNKVFIQ